jgi:hypothetical protein
MKSDDVVCGKWDNVKRKIPKSGERPIQRKSGHGRGKRASSMRNGSGTGMASKDGRPTKEGIEQHNNA